MGNRYGKTIEYAQAIFSSFYLSACSIGRRDCVIDRSLILGTIGGQYVSVQRQGFSVNEVTRPFGSLEGEKVMLKSGCRSKQMNHNTESQEANCKISLTNSNAENCIKKSTMSSNMKEKDSFRHGLRHQVRLELKKSALCNLQCSKEHWAYGNYYIFISPFT